MYTANNRERTPSALKPTTLHKRLSKANLQLIRSLEHKKYRLRHGLFVVEGDKIVREILDSSLTVEWLFAKPAWLTRLPARLSARLPARATHVIEIDDKELSQISFQKTPHMSLALVRTPEHSLDITEVASGLSLYLNGVQDPGNLGTIIRLADWFGIRHVLYDEDCADPFSPKAVQSSMGALSRVKTFPTDASLFRQLKEYCPDFPVYGTFLTGENIYHAPLPSNAVIVMGNESKGISSELAQQVSQRLLIPSYSPTFPGTLTSESLNVATAAAIVCAEFRRRHSNRGGL